MKIAWGKKNGDGRAVLLPGALVSDGAWHTFMMTLEDDKLLFSTDNAITHTYSTKWPTLTDGIFYLGNMCLFHKGNQFPFIFLVKRNPYNMLHLSVLYNAIIYATSTLDL